MALSPDEIRDIKSGDIEKEISHNLVAQFDGTNSVTLILGHGEYVEKAVSRFTKCGWYVKKDGARYEFAPMVDFKKESL